MLSSWFQFPSVSLISPASNSWLHCPALASIFAPWIWCSPFLPAVFWHQSLTTWTVIIYALTSAGYIICGAQWKMKKWGLLFKKQKKKFFPFSLWSLSWLVMVFYTCCLMLHSLMLEDTWGTSVSQSHNSTGGPCVACLAPSLPASCPGPNQWMLGALAVEKQGARSGEKQDGLWAEAPSPWFMLHCPIQLHL